MFRSVTTLGIELFDQSIEIAAQAADLVLERRQSLHDGHLPFAVIDRDGRLTPVKDWCELYIMPGFRFQVIDNLITNFHLPESSLLFLVSALCGRKTLMACYREAIALDYRFYSYGDAMAIID